jgi:hypothetical protein
LRTVCLCVIAGTIVTVCLWSASTIAQSTQSITEEDRQAISDWLYDDWVNNSSPRSQLGVNEDARRSFCRCVGDYLTELMTEDEVIHLAKHLSPTNELIEKSERVKSICSVMREQ